jgi:hypothetical protein
LEYIVPIRFHSKLLGTGIIHKSLLITAAHVVEELEKEKIEFSFVYHHQHFAMNWNCKLFYEYDKEKKRIYKDLAIFKTNIISGGLPIEPENNYDAEAIRVELRYAGPSGYVANSVKTVARGCYSGGRLYDKILDSDYGMVKFIIGDTVIAKILSKEELDKEKNNPDSDINFM